MDRLVDGGIGSDILVLKQDKAMTINLSSTTDQVAGGGTCIKFENVDGSALTKSINVKGSDDVNVLVGGSGADTFNAGKGDDFTSGNKGNDTYIFARGDGLDILSDEDATVNNKDTLSFAAGVNNDQLWFAQIGTGLQVSVIGTLDALMIDNWFTGSQFHVESIQAGGHTLSDTNVAALVSAMAGLTPPAFGETDLSPALHTALDAVIAANWS
jgi:Ca2+-binding RTX toxin-like protein